MADFVKVKLEAIDRLRCKAAQKEFDERNGIRHELGGNRWTGKAGEIAFERFLGDWAINHLTAGDADPMDYTVGGRTVDVKTVACASEPQPEYKAAYEADQARRQRKAELLVFCRYVLPLDTAIFVGWLPEAEFMAGATLRRKGEPMDNGRPVQSDFWERAISELRPMAGLITEVLG